MKYVALLRGINVGGNNKIDMKELVDAMESAGFESASTYINSGNIFFEDSKNTMDTLTQRLESVIHDAFRLDIKALLRTSDNIDAVVSKIPDSWTNDSEMKCDVMFLWDEYDNKRVLDDVTIKSGIDTVQYVDGALIWKVDRKDATRSGMQKLIGTKLYKNMTIRNVNTLRKIQERMT